MYPIALAGKARQISLPAGFHFGSLPSLRDCSRSITESFVRVAGNTRSADLPGIPTIKESGIGDFDASTTYALFAPKGTPPEIANKLYMEIRRALENEDVQRRFRATGVEP